jgi:hypothetical protein
VQAPAEPSASSDARRPGDRLAVVVMALLSAAAFVALMAAGRRLDFFYDEWSFVQGRQAWTLGTFLEPHNEHISVLPVLSYKLLFETVGLAHHWPYRAVVAALFVACGFVVFLLARRRVGPWPALVAGTLVLVMGRSAENSVWAFQVGFVGSVLFGLLAFLALDRDGRRSDVLATLALGASMLCSSLGIPFAAGVAAELLVRRRARGLWVPALPVAGYLLWRLGYGNGADSITGDSVVNAGSWALDLAATSAGAVAGLSIDWGRVLLVGLVAVLVVRIARRGVLSPRLAGLATTAVAFWGLTGMARSLIVPATSSRYLLLGAVVVILISVELLRGVRLGWPELALGAGLVAVAGLAGLPFLRDYASSVRVSTGVVDAQLAAVELAGERAPAGFEVNRTLAPGLRAGPFRDAVRTTGSSPADSPADLERAFNSEREAADRVLQELLVRAGPATATLPRGCRRIPAGPAAPVTVPDGAALVLRGAGGTAQVRVRRFGDGFTGPPLSVRLGDRPAAVRFGADRSPRPYVALVSAPRGGALLCAG